MEKALIIGSEVCAVLLSIMMVYHYIVNHCSVVVILFSLLCAILAIFCHKVQKPLKFDFRLW